MAKRLDEGGSITFTASELEGRVSRVDGSHLWVEVTGGDVKLPATGAWIAKATLGAGRETFEAHQLRVHDVRIEVDRMTVHLATDDLASEARIWAATYAASRADLAKPRPPPSTDSLLMPFRGHNSRDKWEQRAEWLRGVTGAELRHMTDIRLDPAEMQGHVENFVGSVEIPVGLVGPLLIHGEHVNEHCYAPFATTEGALVASATRGATTLTRAGGVRTHVVYQRMNRGPVFVTRSMDAAIRLRAWILSHEDGIRAQIAGASRYAKLITLDPIIIGRNLHVRFVYETGDAAGQNMTTVCTWRACQWMRAQLLHHPEVELENFFIEGNTSGDKKASHISSMSGRGTRVSVEAFIPGHILKRCLKVSPEQFIAASNAGLVGSAYVGMMGINVNVANSIAAMFTACGQDIGSVHESSLCQLHLNLREGGVYVTALFPALVIGTVGGGTGLPTQSDALRIMGCNGAGKTARLAEMIAAFALALEISTLSAIASGDFVAAHETLGRPKHESGIAASELSCDFFTRALRSSGTDGAEDLEVVAATPFGLEANDSILSDLAVGRTRKLLGLLPYELSWIRRAGGDDRRTRRVVVKSKPVDREIIGLMNSMAKLCGDPIATLHDVHRFETGFRDCHVRELAVSALNDPAFTAIAAKTYSTYRREPTADDPGGAYVLVMEFLDDVSHLNTVNTPEAWEPAQIRSELRDIAGFDAAFLDRARELAPSLHLDPMNVTRAQKLAPLWDAIVGHNTTEYPEIYTPERAKKLRAAVGSIREMWTRLEAAPNTLVHNDFNLRNVCLRRSGALCVYDWELATVHVPQRDICEFLAYVLVPETPLEIRDAYVDFYRNELERASGRDFPRDAFMETYVLASLDFALTRLALVSVAHGFKSYDYLPRVLESHFRYLDTVDVP